MGEPNYSQRVSQHGSHTELRSANRNRTHGISPVGHLRHYLSHLSRDFDGPRETNHQMASLPFRSMEVILNYVLQIVIEHMEFHPSAILGIICLILAVILMAREKQITKWHRCL